MIDPSLVIFAIEAGAKLGRKINEVLVDQTAERPLVFPLGDLAGSIAQADANEFFEAHPDLTAADGSCAGFADAQKLQYYRTAVLLQDKVYSGLGDPKTMLVQLRGLEQFRQGYGVKNPVRRVAGTLIEIGVDFCIAHPEALGRDSTARKLIVAFVTSLDDTDFSDASSQVVLRDIFSATLVTLADHASLVADERRVQALVGGIARTLADDFKKMPIEARLGRQQLLSRIGSSLVRGAAGAFTENLDLFIPANDRTRGLVQSTLEQVLAGIKDNEDLFTNETIELVFRSALRATAENPGAFTDNKVLGQLIGQTVGVLADRQWDQLFTSETAGAILFEALEVARENIETLIAPDTPREQLVARTLAAVAASLSTALAGGGKVQDLLSRRQLIELTRAVLGEVARHPDQLVGADGKDPRLTVLAQVVGSVAKALGKDPKKLVNGTTFIEVVRIALRTAALNVDRLIDLESQNTRTNLLFDILRQVAAAIEEAGDARALVSRDVFLEIVRRALPVASANVAGLTAKNAHAVQQVVAKALELAEGALAQRINGANLPVLIEALLRDVLWDKLRLDQDVPVQTAAALALQSA